MADTIEVNGVTFTVQVESDVYMGEPWKEHDGHGVVSEWTSRGKHPGERVLVKDGGKTRYYDVSKSMRIARRDGWDAAPYGGTAGQRAARAVAADFKYLRDWCNGAWEWVFVAVTAPGGACESLGGIESSSVEYIEDVARELAEQVLAEQLA